MAGKKGIRNVKGMRHRRKGGQAAAEDDGFDRSRPDTLASLIDQWQERLAQRNYSPHTLEAHKWALRAFLQWAEARDLRNPADITKPILEGFQRWLYHYRQDNGKLLAVGTQRSRLGAIQRFFAHLCKTNHLQANPAADLDLPRKQRRRLPRGCLLYTSPSPRD